MKTRVFVFLIVLLVIFVVGAGVFRFIEHYSLLNEGVGTYISFDCVDIIVVHDRRQFLHEEGHGQNLRCGNVCESPEFQASADLHFPTFGLERDYCEFYADYYAYWRLDIFDMPKDFIQYFDCYD